MTLRFLSIAKIELDQSFEYYESQKLKLGESFLQEVRQGVKRIKNQPTAWSRISKRTRRCLLNKFPFGIIYQLTEFGEKNMYHADETRKSEYFKVK